MLDLGIEFHGDTFLPCTPSLNSTDVNSFVCNCNLFHLNIFHCNIRSLRSNFDELICYLSNLMFPFDIIVLSEIWIKLSETQFYKISGYNEFFQCRDSNKSGGVVIYVRNNLTNFINVPFVMKTGECVSIYSKSNDFQIIGMYRSHQYNPKEFLTEFEENLKSNKFKNIYIIGDININILDTSSLSDHYLNLISTLGFKLDTYGITRNVDNINSCIDHIFYRITNNLKVKSGIINYPITDHYPICSSICLKTNVSDQFCLTKKININLSVFKDMVRKSVFNCQFTLDLNSDIIFSDFMRKISNLIASSVNSSVFKKYKNIKKPWISPEILKLIDEKEILFKLYQKNKFNQAIKNRFTLFRNMLTSRLRTAKSEYFHNKFLSVSNNIKEQWKIIREVLNEKQLISLPSSDNFNELANSFNKHFSSVFNSCSTDVSPVFYNANIQTNLQSMFFEPVDVTELTNIINSLPNKKSTGFDKIDKNMIIIIFNHFSDLLTNLINISFDQGIFFSDLKKSLVVPIFKKGDKNDLNNYRPISLLSIFSKVIEKIMHTRLTKFLEKHSVLADNQYGFRKGKGTELALMKFTKIIYSNENNNLKSAAVFLDISKAFDTVNHKLLLKKLHCIGIRGYTYSWFESYLSGRTQIVKIDNTISSEIPVNGGVPQGSILGPLLFLIFINDFCNLNLNCDIITFADDTVLVFSAENYTDLYKKIEFALQKANIWFNDNLLKLNVLKTKFIIFSLKVSETTIESLKIHDASCDLESDCTLPTCCEIKRVDSIKYLGIQFDSNLKWKSHINYLLNRLRFINLKFFRLKRLVDHKFLTSLYFAWVQSSINYGITCYASDYYSNIKPLNSLQNKILSHIQSDSLKLPILTVRELYVFRLLYFIFNNKSFYQSKTSKYSLRNIQGNYFIPKSNKTIFQKSHVFLGPFLFNKLNESLKTTINRTEFKNGLYNFLARHNNIEVFFNLCI